VRKAAAAAPHGVGEALREFRSLNTREARAAFADHWIGLWARDFDQAWPMLYELLQIVEEDKLYADPRRVGPGAGGGSGTHGGAAAYDSFAAYFEDRVKRPFIHWSELDKTYHYVQRYAPELFGGTYDKARRIQEADRRDQEQQRPVGANQHSEGVNNINTRPQGTSEAQALRRLRRDRPDLHAEVLAGSISPHAAMVLAGFRRRTGTVRYDDAESAARTLRKHMPREALLRLAELLTEEGE
jgi:hypothetical protein